MVLAALQHEIRSALLNAGGLDDVSDDIVSKCTSNLQLRVVIFSL